jgi:protoheme IX farnesyltransferase
MEQALMGDQAAAPSKMVAYFELTKPELTFLSALTAGWAFVLASDFVFATMSLGILIIANLMIGAGAGSLNMYVERITDGLMRRTERRPLPSERLSPGAVLAFGFLNCFAGLFVLCVYFSFLPATIALITLVIYLLIYTPLKRKTSLNTFVGAVPGALPTLIGWTAAKSAISLEAWMLFTFVFIWQLPHFHSLAWMYRKDYARAGFKMTAVLDGTHGRITSTHIITSSFLFIPLSIGYYYLHFSGWLFGIAGTALAFLMLIPGWKMTVASSSGLEGAGEVNANARRVFFGSLVALPLYMLTLLLDRARF